MTVTIGRRELLVALGGAAVAWPLTAHAQQTAMPVIGFLNGASPGEWAHLVAAFRRGLNEIGYVEGQNVSIDYRWADGHYDRLPALAADLVRRQVAVIAASGGTASALAAKAATTTTPIVSLGAGDPVSLGLVASLNRPGGNVTGVYQLSAALGAKRLGLAREMVATTATIGVLLNPTNPNADIQLKDLQEAARVVGQQLHVMNANNERDVETAFAALAQSRTGALLLGADPFFLGRRDKIVEFAARHAIPTIYEQREFSTAGGLMSYGTNLADAYRQAGVYTGRVLKGEKASDLPVVQSAKFELVINLKTAKALGLEIPPGVLAIADEVIE